MFIKTLYVPDRHKTNTFLTGQQSLQAVSKQLVILLPRFFSQYYADIFYLPISFCNLEFAIFGNFINCQWYSFLSFLFYLCNIHVNYELFKLRLRKQSQSALMYLDNQYSFTICYISKSQKIPFPLKAIHQNLQA